MPAQIIGTRMKISQKVLRKEKSMDNVAIQTLDIIKLYGQKMAVNHVNLTIPTGSFYGLVGPNGAGKTTLLSMCTGLLQPDHGTALINGYDMWKDPVPAKTDLGVLPDGMHMFDRLSGIEHLVYVAQLRGISKTDSLKRAESLLETFDLPMDKKKSVGEYSTGMRKKLGLALALVNSPKIVVLDEPFEAVDPISANVLQNVLKRFVNSGGTVILSSHVMATVQELCSHVAIMADGQLKANGTVSEVAGEKTLNERFIELVGDQGGKEGDLSWLAQ